MEDQDRKKNYFNTSTDGHHCHFLPHPVWQGQGDGPQGGLKDEKEDTNR